MRTASFRDDVLWPIAYKLGLDPEVSLLKNQAYALASYINAYVRRLWDASDWAEWTVIGKFSVDTDPRNPHNVSWDAPPGDYLGGPLAPAQDQPAPGAQSAPLIGRVLKVYLVDPKTTWAPVDTPFRLSQRGIHVGFEHGSSVWIKYVARAPKFTAKEWNAAVNYNKGDLTYSPVTGGCYTSKASNNLNHDPSQPGGTSGPLDAPLVEETVGAPDNPGLAGTTQIVDVNATLPVGFSPVPDPPASGSIGTIVVLDSAGATLATATHTATGSESLLAVFTDLQSQLSAALAGFTVTLSPTPLKITLEHASDFTIPAHIQPAGSITNYPLTVAQTQKYAAPVPPSLGVGQQLKLTITQEQVVPGALYTTNFTTVDGAQHLAAYTALSTDNAVQILSGLIDNVIALQPTDPFFMGVSSTLDTVSPSTTYTIDKTLGLVSMHVDIAAPNATQPPSSTFWDLVPFPFALVDQVVRGAYADALAEGGQTDKASAEEQLVPTENQVRVAAQSGPNYLPTADQQKQTSRYAVK